MMNWLRNLFRHKHHWIMSMSAPWKYRKRPGSDEWEYKVDWSCRCGGTYRFVGSEQECRDHVRIMWLLGTGDIDRDY